MTDEIRYSEFKVIIPSLEGDAIAETIAIQVPVTICPTTGEEMLTEKAFEMIEATKSRHMGLLSPAEIKAVRMRLKLSQKEMANLIQAGEKSYTRWESGGARPSRMVNVLLRAIQKGIVTVDWLRSLQSAQIQNCHDLVSAAVEGCADIPDGPTVLKGAAANDYEDLALAA